MANCAAQRNLVDKRDFRSWPIAPDRGLQLFGRCWGHSGRRPTLEPQVLGSD